MATPSSSPDLPPAVSAAELRRKLLASTPPAIGPMAVGEIDLAAEVAGAAPGPAVNPVVSNAVADLLSRLKLPGQANGSKAVATPSARIAVPPTESAPVNQRTPNPGAVAGLFSAVSAANRDDNPARPDPPGSELHRLRSENKELRQLLNEMKQLLQEASDNEQAHAAQNVELQTVLDEKNRQVDEISSHLKHFEDQIAAGALAPVQPQKTRSELEEWADELERENAKLSTERKELETERKQLREDEETLEKQMRQMEVSMAKDRAIMARQEMELRRLHGEIQNELELMQRGDATLREHMTKFQRRAQEVMQKPGGGTTASGMWGR